MIDIKAWFETGAAIAGTIGGGIIAWVSVSALIKKAKTDWGDRKHKKEVGLDRAIHEQLSELRHESDACRTKLFLYHNGTSFANGTSMKKMSLTHESCHAGMVPTFKGNNDHVLSLFVDMFDLLETNKPHLVCVSTMKDSYFKSYLQSNHVLMISLLPVKNVKENQIGCVMCEWCAWAFADKVEEDRFGGKFTATRNSIQYLLSTDKRKYK